MRNTISCQECGKGLILPTIFGVECDDFLEKSDHSYTPFLV